MTARVERDPERSDGVERGDGLRRTGESDFRGRRRREGKDLTQSDVLDDEENDDDTARPGSAPIP